VGEIGKLKPWVNYVDEGSGERHLKE